MRTCTVPHDGQCDVAETIEDDDDAEPDLPRVDVVFVKVAIEPSDSEVIGCSHDPCRTNGVVSADVGDDRDLGRESDVTEQEAAKEFGERTTDRPETDGMEQQFVASIRVLLPSCQLVVDGERDTFFEAFTCPCSQSDDVAIDLKSQRHVEVLADMTLGPELLVAVLVEEGDLLDCRPSKDCIVTNEGRDIAV